MVHKKIIPCTETVHQNIRFFDIFTSLNNKTAGMMGDQRVLYIQSQENWLFRAVLKADEKTPKVLPAKFGLQGQIREFFIEIRLLVGAFRRKTQPIAMTFLFLRPTK